MPKESIRMSKQVRPSELEVVSLDDSQERRFRKLEEDAVMIDLHEHPICLLYTSPSPRDRG